MLFLATTSYANEKVWLFTFVVVMLVV